MLAGADKSGDGELDWTEFQILYANVRKGFYAGVIEIPPTPPLNEILGTDEEGSEEESGEEEEEDGGEKTKPDLGKLLRDNPNLVTCGVVAVVAFCMLIALSLPSFLVPSTWAPGSCPWSVPVPVPGNLPGAQVLGTTKIHKAPT